MVLAVLIKRMSKRLRENRALKVLPAILGVAGVHPGNLRVKVMERRVRTAPQDKEEIIDAPITVVVAATDLRVLRMIRLLETADHLYLMVNVEGITVFSMVVAVDHVVNVLLGIKMMLVQGMMIK